MVRGRDLEGLLTEEHGMGKGVQDSRAHSWWLEYWVWGSGGLFCDQIMKCSDFQVVSSMDQAS